MYSLEEKEKAVNLYIKYGHSSIATIRELGYPNRLTLRKWYYEFRDTGKLSHRVHSGNSPYSEDEQKAAVKFYVEHGRRQSYVVESLGYPKNPHTLANWIKRYAPNELRICNSGHNPITYEQEVKEAAVIDFCNRDNSVEEIAKKHNVKRSAIYFWKNQMLGEDYEVSKNKNSDQEIEDLKNEAEALRKEVKRLRLEKDVLTKATEVLKKEKGISLDSLTNREKAMVIDALRNKYTLTDLLVIIKMAKSSYCYQELAMKHDKYSNLRLNIKEAFQESRKSYGYRRIHLYLRNRGILVSEKVIRRLMKESGLKVSLKMIRKYNSYKGEITPPVENLVKRNFHADRPNELWLSDITEFHIPAGRVYLSPIIDCFDGIVVSWTIGTSPSSELANTMLLNAISTINQEHPIVHTDRGFHYRTNGWIQIMNDYGLIRSMSKKGCSADNSACEGFFGRLKNEMFYNRKWVGVSIDEFVNILDEYIHWYNEGRIKESLGGLSPLDYRKKLGLTA